MRTRPGLVEPEVYFRIVHLAQGGHNGDPAVTYREQTVEIARREGITRARVIQVMGMLRLAPEIQQRILSILEMVRRPPVTERMLRPIEPISITQEESPNNKPKGD